MGRYLATGSAIVTLVGGAVVVAASLMPWSYFDSMLFSIYSVTGVGLGYGVLTLLAGVGLVAIGAGALLRPVDRSLISVAVGLAIVAVAIPVVARFELGFRGDEGPLFTHPARLTLGIYLTELGGLLALVGSLGLQVSRGSKSSR